MSQKEFTINDFCFDSELGVYISEVVVKEENQVFTIKANFSSEELLSRGCLHQQSILKIAKDGTIDMVQENINYIQGVHGEEVLPKQVTVKALVEYVMSNNNSAEKKLSTSTKRQEELAKIKQEMQVEFNNLSNDNCNIHCLKISEDEFMISTDTLLKEGKRSPRYESVIVSSLAKLANIEIPNINTIEKRLAKVISTMQPDVQIGQVVTLTPKKCAWYIACPF